jgi:hypothetical protein
MLMYCGQGLSAFCMGGFCKPLERLVARSVGWVPWPVADVHYHRGLADLPCPFDDPSDGLQDIDFLIGDIVLFDPLYPARHDFR